MSTFGFDRTIPLGSLRTPIDHVPSADNDPAIRAKLVEQKAAEVARLCGFDGSGPLMKFHSGGSGGKQSRRPVRCVETGARYHSVYAARVDAGCSASSIHNACNNGGRAAGRHYQWA